MAILLNPNLNINLDWKLCTLKNQEDTNSIEIYTNHVPHNNFGRNWIWVILHPLHFGDWPSSPKEFRPGQSLRFLSGLNDRRNKSKHAYSGLTYLKCAISMVSSLTSNCTFFNWVWPIDARNQYLQSLIWAWSFNNSSAHDGRSLPKGPYKTVWHWMAVENLDKMSSSISTYLASFFFLDDLCCAREEQFITPLIRHIVRAVKIPVPPTPKMMKNAVWTCS